MEGTIETEERVKVKKRVPSRSGHCAVGSPTHRLCWGEWETPSVIGVCQCECHKEVVEQTKKVIVPKVSKEKSAKASARVLVPKK